MQNAAIKSKLVGPGEIAIRLGVSRNTILNWAGDGKIPAIRIGRIYRFSLERVSEALGHEI